MGVYTFDTEEAMRLWEEGLNDREIGDRLNVAAYCINRWRNSNKLARRHRTACFDEELAREMWQGGACDPEIAKAMFVNAETISCWRRRNGLKGNRPKRFAGQAEGYHQGVERRGRKENPTAPGHVDRLCDKTCEKCRFWGRSTNTCDYILVMDQSRGCPVGKGCKRMEPVIEQNNKRIKWDEDKAWKLWEQGKCDAEIAREVGISSWTIGYWRKNRNLAPNVVRREANRDWDRAEARRLYGLGWDDQQIGKALDVSASAIWKWRQREGLKPNGK